jgi:hypothetical protein
MMVRLRRACARCGLLVASVKVRGQWRYVYRAIDQFGQVIDVFVSPRRDTTAARRFFHHALATTQVTPTQVITDKAATYPIVLEELLPAAWHRTEPYADNHIEADHGLWVPDIRSQHATCAYAWISPPTPTPTPAVGRHPTLQVRCAVRAGSAADPASHD